jgi:hypothetical protein
VLAAPVAWLIAELVGYAAVSLSCVGARGTPGGRGTVYASVGLVAITVVTGLVAAAGLFTGYQSWQVIRRARAEGQQVPSSASFIAFAGIFVSLIFLLNIILFGVPVFVVNVCSKIR